MIGCYRCGQIVYLVQSPTGEKFLVDHNGKRWCA